MATFDEASIIQKHVRSINFLKNASTRTTETLIHSAGDSEVESSSRNVSCPSNVGSDKADSIRSYESVIKVFRFETESFNQNNEKCLAFWNAMNNRTDITPVNCTIMDAHKNKKTAACQTEQQETEASLWARALYELRKRKLDQVALAATGPSCEFCKAIIPVSPKLDPNELEHDQDLTELDCWTPSTMNKTTQFSTKDISLDVATSVQTGLTEEPHIEKSASTSVIETSTIEDKAAVDPPFIELISYSQESGIESIDVPLPSSSRTTEVEQKIVDIDGVEKTDAWKDIGPPVIKPPAVRKLDGKPSDEYLDNRKVSISDVVKISVSSRTTDKLEDVKSHIKSGANLDTSQKPVQTIESKAKNSTTPGTSPKRMSFADVSRDMKGETSYTRSSNGTPKYIEPQRKSKEEHSNYASTSSIARTQYKGLKSTSLPKQPSIQGSMTGMNNIEQATIKEFRKLSQKIEESIALSNEREKDIFEKEQETNLTIRNSLASNATDSRGSVKNSRDVSKRSTKSDGFPRKQISFYGESSPQKKSPLRILREDGEPTVSDTLAGAGAALNETVMGTSLTNGMHQIPSLTPDSVQNIVDLTLGTKSSTLSDDKKVNRSQKNSKGALPAENSFPTINVSSLRKVEGVAEGEKSKIKHRATDIPHLSSLLYADTLKNLEAIAKRKKMLEDELRKSQILEEGQSLEHNIYLCPCLQTLEKDECSQCTCNKGICLKPDESDLKKIEDFFEHLPQTKKPQLKCFAKVLVKIKHIMKMKLDQATTDQHILEVLTGLGPCECEDDPCDCQLHHLVLDAKNADYNFMAATVLQKFNSMLDERLQTKLGVKLEKTPHLKNRSMETDEEFVEFTNVPEKIECNICNEKDCTCVTKSNIVKMK